MSLISIRYTLRALRRQGTISRAEEGAIAADLKAAHFSERTLDRIRATFAAQLPPARVETGIAAYLAARRDAKGEDGERLLQWLAGPASEAQPPDWEFPRTVHWVHQFEDRIADVPKLGEKIV